MFDITIRWLEAGSVLHHGLVPLQVETVELPALSVQQNGTGTPHSDTSLG